MLVQAIHSVLTKLKMLGSIQAGEPYREKKQHYCGQRPVTIVDGEDIAPAHFDLQCSKVASAHMTYLKKNDRIPCLYQAEIQS